MKEHDENYRLAGNDTRAQVSGPGLLGKVITFVTGAALLVVGLMFSLLVFALAATAAGLILGYLWWMTREQRRQMREYPSGGRVIEGELIREPVQSKPGRSREAP